MTQSQHQLPFNEHDAREITAGAKQGQITTRLGIPVRIVCWNARGQHPIVGLVWQADGGEAAKQYTLEGKRDTRDNVRTPLDLVITVEGEL